MRSILKDLRHGLTLSVIKESRKDGGENFSSLAISESGSRYLGGTFHSDTNLLDVPAEQAALMRSIHARDHGVTEIVTMAESSLPAVSPLVLKIIADHSYRTGKRISYKIVDTKGVSLYETKDVRKALSFYKPPKIAPLPRPENLIRSRVDAKNTKNIAKLLKSYAIEGIANNFPTYQSASGYGAALLSTNGTLYYGGQYSSFEKRSGLHAEMAVVISALMDGATGFKALGVVSSKHKDSPCEICGCCRQFLSEIIEKRGMKNMTLYCFAKDTEDIGRYTINDLLPNRWSSKKW